MRGGCFYVLDGRQELTTIESIAVSVDERQEKAKKNSSAIK